MLHLFSHFGFLKYDIKMKLYFILLFIVGSVMIVKGQRSNQIDVSNLPYYNFGKGIGITAPDSLFQFNIRFRMQNRFTVSENEENIAFNGQIRRLRLRFDGFVGNPNFLYVLQLSFSPGDVGGEIIEGENLNIIRDAVVYYKLSKKFNVGFGQTKLPGNRQRINSSGALQLSDRTINNAYFNIDRDFGFFFNYLNEKPKELGWNLKSSITLGEGRNFTETVNEGLAYTTRFEILPFGSFTRDGVFFEGDIFREKSPKLMVSGVYHFNHKALNTSGTLGNRMSDSKNLHSLFLDAVFKYNGWAFMSSYMMRHTDVPESTDMNNNRLHVYKGQGYDIQTSYSFPSAWEIIANYSEVTPHDDIKNVFPKEKSLTLGLTKYIWEHAFKVQLEAGYNTQTYFNGTNENPWRTRLQVEMGI